MRKLLIVLSLGLLTSCSIHKDYIIVKGTYETPSIHEHLKIDGEEVCFYFETYTEKRVDTLYAE